LTRKNTFFLAFLPLIFLFWASCKSYKQDYLFTAKGDFKTISAQRQVREAERNYVIKENDLLEVNVYTNKGELLIDPNNELLRNNRINQQQNRFQPNYLVNEDGLIKLPIIDEVEITGLTLREAEELLEQRYAEFYKGPFVLVRFANKRVIVLGATGGQVIPLSNENMTILEVIALAGGFQKGSKAHNIRLVRGELDDPEVFLIDLSTVEGMKESIVQVEPGDIIYIEPVRRIVGESIRDISPVISIISSTIALIIVILEVN